MDSEHDIPKQDPNKEFKCRECEYTFGGKNDLKYHMKKEHETMVQPCNFFSKGVCHFSEERCWYSHKAEKIIESATINNFICKYCGDSFGVKSELMIHRKLKHSNNVAECREYVKGNCKFENKCWFKHNKDIDVSQNQENLRTIKYLKDRILMMENQIGMDIN